MKKILVIDDEESLRAMVRAALEQRGFAVVEAENGRAGVEQARRELPDLILCDVRMEQMDGYQALAILRDDPVAAAIPVILMTGVADQGGMRQGMELGADDYLPKPFTIEGLYAAVEARLKKAQRLREEAEKKLTELRESISLALPHGLRTPLNGILAYGEILASDAASLSPEEISEMGRVVQESGAQLQRLIENFLIYAQLELTERDPQMTTQLRAQHTPRCAAVVEQQARAQASAAQRPDDLALELTDGAAAISEQYLAKIVDELVQNAFKFSAAGTPVRVVLRRESAGMTLAVADLGRGMTPEQIARVGAYMQFQRRFYEQQGLGLGLAIAKRLAELHHGSLSIQSDPGHGTTVMVRLPAPSA